MRHCDSLKQGKGRVDEREIKERFLSVFRFKFSYLFVSLSWSVFNLGCKFFLYFSLYVCLYNDPPFTPPKPKPSLSRKPWFYVGNKLRNVKFRTLTLRQREMNNVDDQRIISLLFPIDLPTFLVLEFVVMKVKRGNCRSLVFNCTVELETRYTRPPIPVDSLGKNCIPVGLIKHSLKKKS